jgi:hypothetical protein
MKLLSVIVSLLVFFFSVTNALAVYDPSSVPNNKVGIHIFNEKDLEGANKLINSSGGKWGYVTIVITEAERDHDRWQNVFDQMRRLHLIPIVRLATKAVGDKWNAPQESEIDSWVSFLNSLNWVIQNRYVIINNEPNHAKEWGGRIDPEGYAEYLAKISLKLKAASTDFYVLPAGLDPTSINSTDIMSESQFIGRMLEAEPKVFDQVDGWSSHSYPNVSIAIYNQELALVGKKMPVFITETGWPANKYSDSEIGANLVDAYQNTWNDPTVVAVTPFILDYTTPPFDIFSWRKPDGSYRSFYEQVQKTPKIEGQPVQIEGGQILAAFIQPLVFTGLDFVGVIVAKNTGQTIWIQSNTHIDSESGDFDVKAFSLNSIEPMKLGLILFRAQQSQNKGIYTNSLYLKGSKMQKITNSFSVEAGYVNFDKAKISNLIYTTLRKILKI